MNTAAYTQEVDKTHTFKKDFRYVFGLSCIFFTATILFFLGVHGFNHLYPTIPNLVLLPIFAIAFLGIKYKRDSLTKALQPIFYLCVFIPLIYGMLSYLSYSPQTAEEAQTIARINIMLIISIIAAVASLYRPFFAMITFAYLPWRDLTVERMLGVMPNDRIDWIVLVEMGIFILLCTACLQIAEKYFSKEKLYGINRGDQANPIKPQETILIVAICLHLANYFFSFVQKVILDGGPLTWVSENPTYEFLAYAIDRGLFPMAGLPHETSHAIYTLLEMFVFPINLTVLIAQALAIFAFTNKRLLIGLTLFYDMMHLAIFIVTGIFFWKWILLNLTIVLSMKYWKHQKMSLSLNLAAVGFICISVIFFSIARLGWYDIHAGRITHVIAHYKDGSKIQVPTNYFLSYSFRFIFSYDHITSGGFQDNVWSSGVTGKGGYETLQNSKKCDMEMTGTATSPEHPRRGLKIAKSVIRNHHNYILEHVDSNGYINYDLYPHHVWSDPFAFDDFKNSDKRDIVGYEIVNRSICFDFDEDGKYTPIEKHKDSVYVSIL